MHPALLVQSSTWNQNYTYFFSKSTCYCFCISSSSCSTTIYVGCHVVYFFAILITNYGSLCRSCICSKNDTILRRNCEIKKKIIYINQLCNKFNFLSFAKVSTSTQRCQVFSQNMDHPTKQSQNSSKGDHKRS